MTCYLHNHKVWSTDLDLVGCDTALLSEYPMSQRHIAEGPTTCPSPAHCLPSCFFKNHCSSIVIPPTVPSGLILQVSLSEPYVHFAFHTT